MLLIEYRKAINYYIKAVNKGVLKVMSKMVSRRCKAIGEPRSLKPSDLNQDFVDTYFTNTPTRISGIGIDEVAAEVAARHHHAYPERPVLVRISTGAANISGVPMGSTTCTTPTRFTGCSIPRERTTTASSRNTVR
jgi:glutamate synthase domain-containing protein 2